MISREALSIVRDARAGSGQAWLGRLAGGVLAVTSCLLLSGCLGPLYYNKPLDAYKPDTGYRFSALDAGENNSDELFVCLTFSGGGTRAAAFSYGVLEGLRELELPPLEPGGSPRRLLDEVDMISSVSGGSFTAAGYALWRDELFNGSFEERFLKNDIQTVLWQLLWSPMNLLKLPWLVLDRIDVAAAYYDGKIFDRGTYEDLLQRHDRPFIVINSTNLSTGRRFEFTQDDFDLLGSDLASMPLGGAVAASSAFPILLSPLRLKYHPGPATSTALEAVLTDPDAPIRNMRRHEWAGSLTPPRADRDEPAHVLDERSHRFLYLVDGGLADNLGLNYVIGEYRFGAIRRLIDAGKIKRILVIVVDAGTKPPVDWEQFPLAPGLIRVGHRTATTAMKNYSTALIEIIRYLMIEEPKLRRSAASPYKSALETHCPNAPVPPMRPGDGVSPYLAVLNFKRIVGEAQRRKFQKIPTSLFLSPRDVDELIQMGRRMVTHDEEVKRLLHELRGNRSPGS